MNCYFSPELIKGVKINGTIFKKVKGGGKSNAARFEFIRVPCWQNNEWMRTWLWNVLHWIDLIEYNYQQQAESSEDDDTLMAFPLNLTNCDKWFGCKFRDFCHFWANPLQKCDEPPLGFRVDRWDPTEKPATHKFDLTVKE